MLAFSFLAPGITTAQGRVATACKADFKKFCPESKLGDGKLPKCIEKHTDKFSAPCKSALETQQNTRFLAKHPCAPEIIRLCAGFHGKDRNGCITARVKAPPEACRAKKHERASMEKFPCMLDAEKFCKGESRMGPCLKKHEAELSAACKAARAKKGGPAGKK
jgi:hypothetical protein